jgi:hypothetical protein
VKIGWSTSVEKSGRMDINKERSFTSNDYKKKNLNPRLGGENKVQSNLSKVIRS